MKERELRRHAICSLCREKILAGGLPLFWTVKLERYGVRLDAVHRQAGLAAFLGGAFLAQSMGPDEDMAERLVDSPVLTVCERCSIQEMGMLVHHALESDDAEDASDG